MEPKKERKTGREEFEAGTDRKKVARLLQPKPPQRRVTESTDTTITAGSHGDEPSVERDGSPPREDRAG